MRRYAPRQRVARVGVRSRVNRFCTRLVALLVCKRRLTTRQEESRIHPVLAARVFADFQQSQALRQWHIWVLTQVATSAALHGVPLLQFVHSGGAFALF